MLKRTAKKLRTYDNYGVAQSMNFMNESNYKTLLGAFLYLLFRIYFAYRVINYILSYTRRDSFTQVNNLVVEQTNINVTDFQVFNCLQQMRPGGTPTTLKFSDYFTFAGKGWIFQDCKGAPPGSPENFKSMILSCYCGSPTEETFIGTDIYRFNETESIIRFVSKPEVKNMDTTGMFMNTFLTNYFFDYKQIPAFQVYPVKIQNPIDKKTKYTKLDIEELRYHEIIDFDIFYRSETDLRKFRINDFSSNDVDFPNENFSHIFALNPSNFVNTYDITLLSIDNILAIFNGTFTVLSLIFTAVGKYFNNIFFVKQIKRIFLNLSQLENSENIIDEENSFYDGIKEPLYFNMKNEEKIPKKNKIEYQKIQVGNPQQMQINDQTPLENIDLINDDKNKNPTDPIQDVIQVNNYVDKENNGKINKTHTDLEKKISDFLRNKFDNYISSFEFLFDVFTQLELLKKNLLDQDAYKEFNVKSKKYVYDYVKDIVKENDIIN